MIAVLMGTKLILSFKYTHDSYDVILRGSYVSRGNNIALRVVNITYYLYYIWLVYVRTSH